MWPFSPWSTVCPALDQWLLRLASAPPTTLNRIRWYVSFREPLRTECPLLINGSLLCTMTQKFTFWIIMCFFLSSSFAQTEEKNGCCDSLMWIEKMREERKERSNRHFLCNTSKYIQAMCFQICRTYLCQWASVHPLKDRKCCCFASSARPSVCGNASHVRREESRPLYLDHCGHLLTQIMQWDYNL